MPNHRLGSFAVAAGAIAASLLLSACGGGGGETHALGEQAVVGYAQPDPSVRTTLGITVLAVRRGTHQELTAAGYEVDEDSRDTTPYYVDVRYQNQGNATVKRDIDVSLEDSDGNLISSTLIFNYGGEPFGKCTGVTEGELKPGQTYQSCTLVLVPEGTDVGKVSFLSDNGPDEEPEFVYWEAD